MKTIDAKGRKTAAKLRDGEVEFVFDVKIGVTARTLDEAKEIFAAVSGAQILTNCKRYKINAR
jgi:hypothetical protein